MTFGDPWLELPPIDRLEGFRPNAMRLYRWVLVVVRCDHEFVPAWTYDGVGLANHGVRVARWPEELAFR